MMIVFLLLTTSALAGLAVGLVFRVWAIALASLMVATLSAIVTWSHGFHAVGGVSVTLGAIVICQVAYLVGVSLTAQTGLRETLAEDEIDNGPDRHGQHGVHRQDGEDNEKPPGASPP